MQTHRVFAGALFAIAAALAGLGAVRAETTSQPPPLPPPVPGLGAYSDMSKGICGEQAPKWNPKELPFIGCFGLASGSSASGTIDGRQLEVTVDEKGEPRCKVDGILVVRDKQLKANVPNVRGGECGGLKFCADDSGRDCSVSLTTLSSNPDKSIYFFIARKVPGQIFYVTNQENWDAHERKKR